MKTPQRAGFFFRQKVWIVAVKVPPLSNRTRPAPQAGGTTPEPWKVSWLFYHPTESTCRR